MAHRSEALRRRRLRSAISAPTPTTSPLRHRARAAKPSPADLTTFVPGRELDDNVQIMLRYAEGARGTLWASQVAPGNENGLMLRVYGEKGGARMAAGQSQLSLRTRRSASRRV